MARKQNSGGDSAVKHRFIDIPLSAADKEQLGALDLEVEFPYGMVEQLVAEGYKFSLSYDHKNHTYLASLTDRLEGSPFNNTTMSGRGSTATNARGSLLYRHFTLAGGDWGFALDRVVDNTPDFE